MSNNVMFSNVIPQIVKKVGWDLTEYQSDSGSYFVLEDLSSGFNEKFKADGTYIDIANQIHELHQYFDAGEQTQEWIENNWFSGWEEEDIYSMAYSVEEDLEKISSETEMVMDLIAGNPKWKNVVSFGEITEQHRIIPTLAQDNYIYKNPYVFYEFPNEICYIPQDVFDDTEEAKDEFGGWKYGDVEYGGYTYSDLYLLCCKDSQKTEGLFNKLIGQYPEQEC